MRQLTKEDWLKILLVAIIAILVIAYFWDAIMMLLFPKKPMLTIVVRSYDEEGNLIWEGELSTVGAPLAVVKIGERELKNYDEFIPKVYVEYETNDPDETVVEITVTRWEVTVEDEYGVMHTLVSHDKYPYPKTPAEAVKVDGRYSHTFTCGHVKAVIRKDDILRYLSVGSSRSLIVKFTATAVLKIRGVEVDRKNAVATVSVPINVEPDPIKGSIVKLEVYIVSMSYMTPLSPP